MVFSKSSTKNIPVNTWSNFCKICNNSGAMVCTYFKTGVREIHLMLFGPTLWGFRVPKGLTTPWCRPGWSFRRRCDCRANGKIREILKQKRKETLFNKSYGAVMLHIDTDVWCVGVCVYMCQNVLSIFISCKTRILFTNDWKRL